MSLGRHKREPLQYSPVNLLDKASPLRYSLRPMSRHLFNERKAAQAAAWLLFRAGGAMRLLKLMKLMYLAERRSLEVHNEPLIGDRLVSMEHGPVLSRTYNHMNGAMPSAEGGWESWIADRSGHVLALRDPARLQSPETQLLALSDSDAETLDEIWSRFGALDQWQLVEHTHTHCPEWQDPGESMIPIEMHDLFLAFGMDDETARAAAARQEEHNAINAVFSREA